MTNQQSGLRFDIYERVHLSAGVLGIKDLEEVELSPHIQVLPQGEQAVLRGNLLLTGTYVDEQDRADQILEHLIPVEITLPMNRVQRVEDIQVEIENFDVDLLSPRTLNITGLLSLGGVEVISPAEPPAWRETEEELVFLHEAREAEAPPSVFAEPPDTAVQGELSPAPRSSREAAAEAIYREDAASEVWTPEEPQEIEGAHYRSAREESGRLEQLVSREEAPKQEVRAEAAEAAEPEYAPEALDESLDARPETPAGSVGAASEPLPAAPASAAAADASAASPSPDGSSFGLAAILNQAAVRANARSQAEAVPAAPAPSLAERVEWKNLLISSRAEQQEFKKLRLCIVQKNDTLETIANRYEVQAREIALHNRLGEGGVSEGQVVYIPK